jgi:hypothetical protein
MAKKSAKELLKSFGDTITKKELKKFEDKGFNVKKAKDFAKSTAGVSLNKQAKTYYKSGGTSAVQAPVAQAVGNKSSGGEFNTAYTAGTGGYTAGDFMSQPEFDYKSAYGLGELEGQIQTNLQKLQNIGAENIANISAGAQRYGYEADERARKYVADRAGQSAEAVENIRAKGNLDLQAIVNAGLKDVENIRGQFGVEQEKTRGEFGVKQEETRQAGNRDVARIAGKAGIYQGLMGAFSF